MATCSMRYSLYSNKRGRTMKFALKDARELFRGGVCGCPCCVDGTFWLKITKERMRYVSRNIAESMGEENEKRRVL